MSKQSQVEQWLLSGKPLTQEQSRKMFNDWRLAAIVLRMRAKGINVMTTLVGDTQHALYYVSASERKRLRTSTNARRVA